MKSGTAIGANLEESIGSRSRKDFLSKVSIAYMEAMETNYWLRLTRDVSLIGIEESETMIEDCDELIRILGSIQKTIKDGKRGDIFV